MAMPAYDWLADRMEAMVRHRPHPLALPLWAWRQYDGAVHARPDLRSSGHLPRGAKGVRIEFEIDDDAVVLSDFEMWHFVLNGQYIADDKVDSDAFDASLAKKWRSLGCWNQDLPQRHRRRIEASWEKIFDLDRAWDEDWWGCIGRDERHVQATFWAIDIGMVRKVDKFVSR